jgi:hypothetical protein
MISSWCGRPLSWGRPLTSWAWTREVPQEMAVFFIFRIHLPDASWHGPAGISKWMSTSRADTWSFSKELLPSGAQQLHSPGVLRNFRSCRFHCSLFNLQAVLFFRKKARQTERFPFKTMKFHQHQQEKRPHTHEKAQGTKTSMADVWKACNLTSFSPCLTGPVDYSFASRQQGTRVQIPRGVLMWNRDSPVSVVLLQMQDII